MTWRIVPLPTDGPLFEGAIAVYGEAFARPPYSDPDRGEEIRYRIRETHSRRAGYKALAALEGERVVGMIYGYRGARGQWWHDTVAGFLPPKLGREWLDDSYELVEVAVDPGYQSRGIGRRLIEELLCDRSEATCVLSTRTDSRAHHLYRVLGFEVLCEMPFAPRGPLFYVMGKRLVAARPSATAAGA
jgi:ribosomal protein S18 acetylase RimI-like enzyme